MVGSVTGLAGTKTEAGTIPQRWRVEQPKTESAALTSPAAWTTTHAATQISDLTEADLDMLLKELPEDMSPDLIAQLRAKYPVLPAVDDPATSESL